MPERRSPEEEQRPLISVETAPSTESDAVLRVAMWGDRLRSVADVEAQKKWQEQGNAVERQARALFDAIATQDQGAMTPEAVSVGLPDTNILIAELSRAAHDHNYQPGREWRETIEGLRHLAFPEGEINVLQLLASPETAASIRWEWWQKEVSGLLRYTLEKDWARLRDTKAQSLPVVPQEEKPESGEPMPDTLPPAQEDALRTSMDPVSESKEGESNGYFSVHAFWGGYYRENVYERYAGGDQWMRGTRAHEDPLDVGALTEERVFRGTVRAGVISPLPLPYGFFPHAASFRSSEAATLARDQHGCFSLDAREAKNTLTFTVVIGKPKRSVVSGAQPFPEAAVAKPYAGAEAQAALSRAGESTIERARKIKKFVQETLVYSNNNALNAVYTSYPEGYFAAVEQYRQADCDVANAYYINLLSAAGIAARMVVGHYVKNTDHHGAAVMGSGTRHAWTEVWDPSTSSGQAGRWVRFDATPPKDPTLDDERPDEESEAEACTQPGDYAEQEAPQLSDEELEKWRKKLAEAAERAKEKTPEQLLDEQFAKEAECTREEAASIRAKLEAARRLRDHKGRIIRQHLSDEFQKIVESNYKDVPAWKGPVPRSEGEEMDDRVMIGKEVLAGNANPLGYTIEGIETHRTQEYGGMDVYVLADRSLSMSEIDLVSQKPKKEEQQLALFLVLDSIHGFSYKTEVVGKQDQLISPLSVRSSVVAFQAGSADTIKPLGATWKPKEQRDVWEGLESNIGGGTPANLGLAKVRQEIEAQLKSEQKRRGAHQPQTKKRLRVVMVFMDGGVDEDKKADFFAQQRALEKLGVSVSSWGMTESARVVEAYPQGHCVPSVREMIEPVTTYIIEKAQALKLSRSSSVAPSRTVA